MSSTTLSHPLLIPFQTLILIFPTLTLIQSLNVDLGIGSGSNGIHVGLGGTLPSHASPYDTYKSLQSWKSAVTGDPSHILSTWVGPDVCSYRGVFCSDEKGANVVVGIDLNRANLEGVLVNGLSFLTDLTLLHLNSNRFSGTVPDTFKNLLSLQELDLSNNLLSGNFPLVTLQIPSLVYLDLRFNSFHGPIPDGLFDKQLDAIFLNDNLLDGEIPSNLGSSSASVINLANNRLVGGVPMGFAYMNFALKEVLLINNRLTGCIPEGVGLLSNMQVLDFSFNFLTGHLPGSLSCLNEMEVLNVGHNRLTGVVPELVCSLKSLVNLTVAYNFFSGFGVECGKAGAEFDFSSNCVPGKKMQRPEPDCSEVPEVGMNCLRIPAVEALLCGTLLGGVQHEYYWGCTVVLNMGGHGIQSSSYSWCHRGFRLAQIRMWWIVFRRRIRMGAIC